MSIDFTVDFDFDAFEDAVYEAARQVFAKLQRDFSNERFYTFNLVTGDVSQYVTAFVNSEEELTRNASHLDLPPGAELSLEDRKCLLRHALHSNKFNSDENGSELDRSFEEASTMLLALQDQLEEIEDRLIEDEGTDEDEFDEFVFDNVHDPIEATLKRVLQRLDQEHSFEATNRRENIHLDVLSSGDLGELMGPFPDLNPPESCKMYADDVKAYQLAQSNLTKSRAGSFGVDERCNDKTSR